ncbi:MAG: TolC family protein [Acidobacteria bacterium]|nr:TolC family protein [Acidobacteriota bacterium]
MKFFYLLFSGVAAFAQEPVMPLSLRKSLEIALAPEGNTRIELAKEVIQQAETRRVQARAALLPNLDGSLSYSDITRNLRTFGISFPSISGFSFSSFAGPFSVVDARASVTQSVLDFSNIRRYQASKAGIDAARRDRDNAQRQVTDQVARAYLLGLRAEAAVVVAQSNVELAESLRKLALTQKDAGTGIGIEVTRAEVQLANENQRLRVAQADRKKAHLQLMRSMDLRLSTRLELTDKLSFGPVEAVNMEQSITGAMATRPDLQAQQQREAVARLNYDATKMERVPSVAAFGDYGPTGPGFSDARATRTVGLALKIPIFDGGRRDARRAEGASLLRQEKIRTRDLREQIELELRVAIESLSSAESQVATAEEGLKLAQREYEQAERRYKAGVANSIEVTDAQTRLIRARDNRLNALYLHNLARLDLGSATGVVERYLP